jgi:hypothetical protein
MIYQTVGPDEPISQGDIFRHVPRVDLSLSNLAVLEDDEAREGNWREFGLGAEITVVLPIKSVTGIVITQNCDAQRGEYLSLCQVDPFLSVLGQANPPKNPKNWQSLIITQARTNHRLFFLPVDESIGFREPMVVDFRVLIRLPRQGLEDIRDSRIARLNDVAGDHFRESFAHFFRRFAYNEWYALNKEEFEAYSRGIRESIEPYPWQR